MKQTENSVTITGLLSEMNLERNSYLNKNTNAAMECIRGSITIRSNIEIDHTPVVVEIPVNFFVNKYTKQNALDGRYDSLDKFMSKAQSIAMVGEAEADVVSVYVKQDAIAENAYFSQDGRLVSYPRINGSFINVRSRDYLGSREVAEFHVTTFIKNIVPEISADGDETGRLKITGVVGKWGGAANVLEFYTANRSVSEGFSGLYRVGDTAPLIGKLKFTTSTEKVQEQMAFGEAQTSTRTTRLSELVITSGMAPLEGDFGLSIDEVREACAARDVYLEGLKRKNAASAVKQPTPFKNSDINDLGF